MNDKLKLELLTEFFIIKDKVETLQFLSKTLMEHIKTSIDILEREKENG